MARKLLKEKSLHLPVRLLLAKASTQTGKLTNAATYMAEAALSDPGNIQLQIAACNMLEGVGKHTESIPFIERSLAASPKDESLWLKLLRAKFQSIPNADNGLPKPDPKDIPAELVTMAQQLLTEFPLNSQISSQAGMIFEAAGLNEAAILCFERALPARPMVQQAHHAWLKQMFESKSYEQISDYASLHGEACKGDALCQRVISAAFENLGQFDKALDRCDAALDIEPDNADYIGARGRILMYLGRFEEALVDLDASLARDPRQPAARHNRCLVQKCLGNVGGRSKG